MNALAPHARSVRTTCPYCGVGCGIVASVDRQGAATISGDPAHPANFGRLCSKGSALGETLALDQRLLHPMLRQADGSLARADWDTALTKVADGLRGILDRDGPDAIAFYLSGQLLTEDYYVANKLMKGFLGSANVDTNSRLCMASSVAGHRRAFGADTVPGIYRDLDEADLIVLVGSNAAWCHPILHQRMMAAKNERGARLVVIDPRRTATAEMADVFLPIAPGADTALFCGLLAHLADTGTLDTRYIAQYTAGFEDALTRSRAIAGDVAATARATGLDPSEVGRFFALFRQSGRVVTCYSQGVNQSAQGTDKVNAIINVHLATGRIGRPGMGPFSLTGQPNAMGGREVGGLANQLAAHMSFTAADIDRVRRFWNAPRMATREGCKAVDMFAAIERGTIKALWVMATNPAVSLPRAGAFRAALDKLELFVVSETTRHNDTVDAGAHVLLPAAAWGEKDGTVTNSERRVSRQRAFLPLPGEAQPDWWIVSEVARRMGFAHAFAYRTPVRYFPRARGPVGLRKRWPARFRSGRSRRHRRCGLRHAGFSDVAFVCKHGAMRTALLRRRRIFHQRPARPFRRAGISAAASRDVRSLSASPQYRTAARSMAQHDAHRAVRAALGAFAGAEDRYSSRRCGRGRPRRGWFRASDDAPWQRRAAGLHWSRPAARLDLCSDSLERNDSLRCACRRIGDGGDGSFFGPAGAESDAGAGRTGYVRLSGFCVDAPAD